MKIKLNNRDNNNIYLEKLDNEFWKLSGGLSYYRISENDGVIDFIDPSGGPFMMIHNFTIEYDNKEHTLREIIKTSENLLFRFD